MISSDPTASVLAVIAPVQWIVDVLKPVLIFFHDTIGVGWGMSIVLLTVVVRALLAPLTVKQFTSMQSMVRVAPQLKALQAKHKDDKQRQQREVMKFYAENKINPFASCLPLVAQMPFFIGLFWLLKNDLRREICGKAVGAAALHAGKLAPCSELPGYHGQAERFLFVPDLTATATGWVLAVLIVLYIGSQLLSSVLTPSTADRNQRMLMYGLPFVFTFFIINFPAGLIVYWITTNLWTVTQGYVLRRRMGPISAPNAEPALAGIPGSAPEGRGGGFMARLAAITGTPSADGAALEAKPTRRASGAGKTAAKSPAEEPTPAAAGVKSGPAGRSKAAKSSSTIAAAPAAKQARSGPPPPPRKKKRSGRRR